MMHGTNQQPTTALHRPISVDIRLCGSIPRNDMKVSPNNVDSTSPSCSLKACLNSPGTSLFGSRLSREQHDSRKTSVIDALQGLVAHQNSVSSLLTENKPQQSMGHVIEPPSWATPAKGETRLEPVCESVGRQTSVDLTTRSSFIVGRSPNTDIQLMHATSSRRHAMVFHHENGCCYVVDCGSAHGTFVNGVRVASPSNGGVVVPHLVKRGALIRFGGPGAPCFVLKSFPRQSTQIHSECDGSPDLGELVRRNTRLNAFGRTPADYSRENVYNTIEKALTVVNRKRSFDSLDSRDTLDEEPCGKRLRCSSPPLSPQEPIRLVSPDLPSIATKQARPRVSFSKEPPQLFYPALVTPEEFSSEEDNDDSSV